eukprot:gene5349-6020_t
MSKAHPPELKKYMDKKLNLKLNGNRQLQGILRGFDPFMNLVLDEAVEQVSSGEHNNVGMVTLSSDVVLSVSSNETSRQLSSSEFFELNFTIARKNSTVDVQNVSIDIRFPANELQVIDGKEIGGFDETLINSNSLIFNATHLQWIVSEIRIGNTLKLAIVARAASSLALNRVITVTYTLQYYTSAVSNESLFRSYSYSKIFYSQSKQPFLNTSVDLSPTIIQGTDLINGTIVVINHDTNSIAYDIVLEAYSTNINVSAINCNTSQSTANATNAKNTITNAASIAQLQPGSSDVCSLVGTIQRNILPGQKIACNVTLRYYHQEKSSNLYPLKDNVVKYVDVMQVKGGLIASLNASRMMAGDVFNLTVEMDIPNSISLLVARILLPVSPVQSARRKRRSTVGNISYTTQPFVKVSQSSALVYTTGTAIKLSTTPNLRVIDNRTVSVDFGLVDSRREGGSVVNSNASTVSFTVLLQVANDPVLLSGTSSLITVDFGNSNASLPIFIVGPIVKPLLTISKYVQVTDATAVSPMMRFTVVVRHENSSTVDADKITITDIVHSVLMHARFATPNGAVTVTPISYPTRGYVITANIDRLKVSGTATLVYEAAFFVGTQISQAKWKASLTWKSSQVNSPVFGPIHSQESCLSTVRKVITKKDEGSEESMYPSLFIFLISFIISIAMMFAFLDLLQVDEANADETELDKVGQARNITIRRQFVADGGCWICMAAAKCDDNAVTSLRYRLSLDGLLKAYEASFMFLIDGMSQITILLAARIKSARDISMEAEMKAQQAARKMLVEYEKIRKPLQYKTVVSSTTLSQLCRQYLKEECELVRSSKAEAARLFESMLPKKLSEDKERELRRDYEELNRFVMNKAYSLRQQMYISVRQMDVSGFGQHKILAWSNDVVTLWRTWLSKKLLREIDIIVRRRTIQESGATLLREQIAEQMKTGETSFQNQLSQRLTMLQKNVNGQKNINVFNLIDNKMRGDLKSLEATVMNHVGNSSKDAMSYITQRWQIFSEKVKIYKDKTDQTQNDVFTEVLSIVKELTVTHLKGTLVQIEVAMIKQFSQVKGNKTEPSNQDLSDEDDVTASRSTGDERDGLSAILECIEDLQADISGAENEGATLIDNFIDEVQDASESMKAIASDDVDNFGWKMEDKISQSKFKFKSLLFALRDMSEHKAQTVLQEWMQCLQKTLTEIYIRADLKLFDDLIQSSKDDEKLSTEHTEQAVIFWFKDIESITRSDFEKIRVAFKDFIGSRKKIFETLFDNGEGDDFEIVTKDFLSKDIEQDFIYNNQTSCFSKEFLICQQFLASMLRTLDGEQYLSDPEVKDCFTRLKKAVLSLTNAEHIEKDKTNDLTKEGVLDLLSDFERYCNSQQVQRQPASVSSIENMIFDGEGMADKIHKSVTAKRKQNELTDVLYKLHSENLRTLASLIKLDKISQKDLMKLARILCINISKKRFDKIMNTLHGTSGQQQDYLKQLLRHQLEEELHSLRPQEHADEIQQEAKITKKKKKKKSNVLRKNIVAPDE